MVVPTFSATPHSSYAKVVDETHLDRVVHILKCTHKVEVNVGAPRVAYRETLARATEVEGCAFCALSVQTS